MLLVFPFLILLLYSVSCRRLSSFVWKGCRLMSSSASSLRVTEQPTEREKTGGRGGTATTQTAALTLLRPRCMSVALTMGEAAAVEATTPPTVGTSVTGYHKSGRRAPDPPVCVLRNELWSNKHVWNWFRAQGWAERLVPGRRRPGWVSLIRLFTQIRPSIFEHMSESKPFSIQNKFPWWSCNITEDLCCFIFLLNTHHKPMMLCQTVTACPQGQGERQSTTERRSQEAWTRQGPRGRTGRPRKRRRTRRIPQQLWY